MLLKERIKQVTVAVIGGGAAGVAAAVWCKRLGLTPFLFESGGEIGGALHQVYSPIIDYPGLIVENGSGLIARLKEHLAYVKIKPFTEIKVTGIQLSEEGVTIETAQGAFHADFAILATGTKAKHLHIPGEKEMIARGELYSTHRDKERLRGKHVLIVGGGDRAVEGALNLLPYAQKVYLIHRSNRFKARSAWVEALKASDVHLMMNAILLQILGEKRVEEVLLRHQAEGKVERLAVDAVIIRIGTEPVTDLIPQELKREGIPPLKIDEAGRTEHPRLFAIGDLVTPIPYASLSVATAQGMRAAKAIMEDLRLLESIVE